MHGNLSSEPVPSSVLAQPFWLLRVDPTATRQQIQEAFESAKQCHAASEAVLAQARDVLIDPLRRVPYELSYPLGSPISELDEWHRLSSSDVQSNELLKYAERLSTLGQSIFYAFIASHRAADAQLLHAMSDAHGRIELSEVYEQLKELRRIGEYLAPPLMSVREALEIQLDIHCQAAVSAYDKIDDAAEAMFGCVQQILANREPHHVDALGRLLEAYRALAFAQLQSRAEDIRAVCDQIEAKPDHEDLIGALDKALERWMVLCRPRILFGGRAGLLGEDCHTFANRLPSLIIDLALRQRYDAAIQIAELGKDRLRLIPAMVKLLDQAAVPARQAHRELKGRKLAALKSVIEQLGREPGPLIEALKQSGFGPDGIGAAKRLWQTFVETVSATRDRDFVEPWTEIRTFAKHLARRRGGVSAALKILQGLRDQLGQISAPTSILQILEEDLRQVKFPARKVKDRGKSSGWQLSFAIAAALLAASCPVLLFVAFDNPKAVLTDAFARVTSFSSSSTATQKQARGAQARGEESPPGVGSQQHLSLSNLRYCQFQEERLRLVKPKVRSAEDTRAFNMLVVDYNSRCSDFLYRDSDAATVSAELNSNREKLAAEADEIVAAWRGQAAADRKAK
jgi:hypothetical protein